MIRNSELFSTHLLHTDSGIVSSTTHPYSRGVSLPRSQVASDTDTKSTLWPWFKIYPEQLLRPCPATAIVDAFSFDALLGRGGLILIFCTNMMFIRKSYSSLL